MCKYINNFLSERKPNIYTKKKKKQGKKFVLGFNMHMYTEINIYTHRSNRH